VEEGDHGLRGLDRILGVLAGDARASVDDPVTALRVRLKFTPPLGLVRWCIATTLYESATGDLRPAERKRLDIARRRASLG
jgi:hypothetical protein